MSYKAIFTKLRALQKTTQGRAVETLPNGVTVEARPNGKWMVIGDQEPKPETIELIARDAGLVTGFSCQTSRGKDSSLLYTLIEPLSDNTAEEATQVLCRGCRKRSLKEDEWGRRFCPACGDGMPEPEKVSADPTLRTDARPGTPLPEGLNLKQGILYHFEARGVVWTVKLEQEGAAWAAVEKLEGSHIHHHSGALENFLQWFEQNGTPPKSQAPDRWSAL